MKVENAISQSDLLDRSLTSVESFKRRWVWKICLLTGLVLVGWQSSRLLNDAASVLGMFPAAHESIQIHPTTTDLEEIDLKKEILAINDTETLESIQILVAKQLKSAKKALAISEALRKKNQVEITGNYKFYGVPKAFKRVDLSKIALLTPAEFEKVISTDMPYLIKKRSKKYIDLIVREAQKRQVDPFWALAVAWVESHFNQKAKSHLHATGLMQIMPSTGQYLVGRIDQPISYKKAKKVIKNSERNIELGVYYLKSLLNRFKGNYILATCSYNMGPAMVSRRLRKGLPVGKRNLYLDKVTNAYKILTKPFIAYTKQLKHPYRFSYVVRNRIVDKTQDKMFSLFPFGLPKDVASWDFKKWQKFEGTNLNLAKIL